MAYDVFVSYAQEDERHANAARAALESEGLRCWIAPRDIVAGNDWGSEIIKGIKSSRVMLVIFSTHANKSRHIKRELTQADEEHLPVITFRVEDTDPEDSLAYYLDTVQWLDAFPRPAELHPRLVSDVKRIVSAEPPPPPPLPPPPPRQFPKWLIVAGAALFAAVLIIGVRAMLGPDRKEVIANANNANTGGSNTGGSNANGSNADNTPTPSSSVAPSPGTSPAAPGSNNTGAPPVVVATPAPPDDTAIKITQLAEVLFREGSTEVARKDAISALEPLARKDLPYHLQVVGHLTDFIRRRAALGGQCLKRKARTLPPDLQEAIDVLGSRRWSYGDGETQRLELSDTDLSGAYFAKRGEGVNFKGVRLRGACLDNAILGGANFRCAYLSGASVSGIDVSDTDFYGADLSNYRGVDAAGFSALFNVAKNLNTPSCAHDR